MASAPALRRAFALRSGLASSSNGEGSSSWRRTGLASAEGRASLQSTLLGQVRHSHVGKAAINVPTDIKLSVLPFAPVANPSRRQPTALDRAYSIRVRGPLGEVLVPLHPFVKAYWDLGKGKSKGLGIESGTAAAARFTSSSQTADEAPDSRRLLLDIAETSSKEQRAMWGLTRSLLANAIKGVQEGHSAVLRLVGVGYRAAIEADPFPRPDKFDEAFEEEHEIGLPAPAERNLSSKQQVAYYADIVRAAATNEAAEHKRLTLRLGFANSINLRVPRGLTCTTPAPTRIVIKGIDKEKVGLFAATIRRYRPPEPYKGKGIFVGDETIRLKSPRKK